MRNICLAAALAVALIVLGVAEAAADHRGEPHGRGGRQAENCNLIQPNPNPVNPACTIPWDGGSVRTTLDDELYELCAATNDPAEFKNDSDRLSLISKAVDAAIKVDRGKADDACCGADTKIGQYEDKLESLEGGTLGQGKVKIDEDKKIELYMELGDVKACFGDAFGL